jgi:hypothetical protein
MRKWKLFFVKDCEYGNADFYRDGILKLVRRAAISAVYSGII